MSVLERPWREILSIEGLIKLFTEFWSIVGPGGKLHPAYFLEHKGHLVIEGLLVAVILYLALQHSYKVTPRVEESLTDKEVQQLCNEWEPEPLVPTLPPEERLGDGPVITGYDGVYATIEGHKERVLHLASSNYLDMGNAASSKEISLQSVSKYGVGSCGPRGFYGTIDVHLELEDALANFFGTERGIIYSYDVATIASVIPAFASRKDIIIMDEACSYPIQAGAVNSRARIYFYKHNDVEDLERQIQKVEAEEKAKKKPLCRKYVITEGIFANTGELAPLDKIYAVKQRHCYRLIVDESHAFGVLGTLGRGAAEHYGLKPHDVEITCGSMSNALGTVGGFCVGDKLMVEHQRLSGLGYVFSASLPPYLAAAGIHVLRQLSSKAGSLLPALRSKVATLRREVAKVPGLALLGGPDAPSPMLHLRLAKPRESAAAERAALQRVADHMLNNSHVLVCVTRHSALEMKPVRPSLVVYCHVGLSDKDLAAAAAALRKAAKEAL